MRVAVLLLLGVVEARGPCFFNRTQERCVCHNLSRKSSGSIIQCLAASVVEFWGGDLERYIDYPITDPSDASIVLDSPIKKIILGDLLIPEVLLARVLRFFSYTQVQELVFKSCVFHGRGNWSGMAGQGLPILSLQFHNVTSAPLLGREEEFSSLGTWLETLEELAVTGSRVTSLPCGIGRLFKALHSLDLAGNSLGDESLMPTFCQGAFPQLQVLSLQHNQLTSYHGICRNLRLLLELQHLDLSQNKLLADPSSSCQWPETLRIFNLSAVGLDEVLRPLPPRLEVLDVSRNHLRAVDISHSFLKKLFLSQNLLEAAPSLGNCPRLDTLHLENNSIAELPWEEVKVLGVLREVALDGNPYSCSCSGAGGLQALAARGHLGQGWPQDYRCHLPPGYQGWQVKDVPVSGLRCHSAAVVVPIAVVLVLLGLAGGLCLLRTRPGLLQPCCRV
ncbi:monocyte differentiation antigen CD14 [Phaethornis superciliosus]